KKYFINKPYFLYVGNAYPHKNLTKLLTAFKLFSQRQKYQLVLVGKNDFFYQRLKTLAKQRNLLSQRSIIFTGFVPDDELAILYQQCQAYIFPSLYEGFGLPPLEAMAQQAPVIAARAGSLPEILGPAALYFDPQQESNIVQVMEQLVDDDSLKQQLIINGNQQIKKYSWTCCAQQTLSIYQQTIKNK
ncbi:MAG: glycosyltransferase family 4 protein, partial [Candidatus Aenigmarchaeota archaeon]|nr:glycosyltransferase family 4 protein [Candidatus Aenigmarchaeota archaeon]